MAPLVPDFINDELNLLMALLVGIAFGFIIEQAGFSSSRKLTGLFYGTDFTVLRVFFTAGVTALSGVLVLTQLGVLDFDMVYVNPTFLHSAILGGVIMGFGFVLGGYCPGTGLCGAAVGRLDGVAFLLGSFAGIFAFGEIFPQVESFYKAGAMGDLLISNVLGLTSGQWALALMVVAVGTFVAVGRIERHVNPDSAMRHFPVRRHRLAAAGLLTVGLALALVPERKTRLLAEAAHLSVPAVAADELAIHILDRDPRLTLVDVRPAAAYAQSSLPGAISIPLDSLFSKEWRDMLAAPGRKVFFDSDDGGARRAASLASLLGCRNASALAGGFDGFARTVLSPGARPMRLSAAEEEAWRFRERVGPQIVALMRERGAAPPKRVVRRVQGGCGS